MWGFEHFISLHFASFPIDKNCRDLSLENLLQWIIGKNASYGSRTQSYNAPKAPIKKYIHIHKNYTENPTDKVYIDLLNPVL
jgi:hypothetical protein